MLVHEGGSQTGTLPDINGCEGEFAGSPIPSIVSRLDDEVDLVISAHTHAAYICRLPSMGGRGIAVTSAAYYGRVLTEIDLAVDPVTRDITAASATNHLVSRSDTAVKPDTGIAAIVTAM